MIFLAMTIICLIIGIVLCIISNYTWDKEWICILGVTLCVLSSISLIIMLIDLAQKPLEYKEFRIQYDTIKEMSTDSEDIRDANYTLKIIEINTKINRERAYIDSNWIGILMNKKIADLELLEK